VGLGLAQAPSLMIIGFKGFVCSTLSQEWLTNVVLSSEVDGLGRLCLSADSFDNYFRTCVALRRRV